MVLQALDLVQPAALLYHARDGLQVGAGHLQQVVDAVKDDLYDLRESEDKVKNDQS